MNAIKNLLKSQIEKLAKEENITFLEACSSMQSACAKLGNEDYIGIIYELKYESNEFKEMFGDM